ncbi:alpha/beta fold hydrolase [Leptolyngbya ohadii]|uniref:alpha/beta fold hydrolase n=1 Tax=Leptolyngbya ohadii TaxID=1962290 RepID=UPI000B59CF6B|nr:alpha/beta hydrolase [Leptolyngbya ohadii]
MPQFQPPGFTQHIITTSLGVMVYYTPTERPWRGHPEVGEDLPPLVFLHSLGGGSSAYEWSKVYPAFAPDYRVIAPDLVGWGRSTHPVRDYQPEDYFQMVTELLEKIGEPATIVSASLTGGLMIRLAIQRPDLIRSLFLVSPAGYADFDSNYGNGLPAKIAGIPGIDRLLYSAGAANEFAVRNFLENFLFADRSRVTQEMVEAYLASAQQLNGEYSALASLRGDLCFDLSLYMRQLTVPTIFVWGEKSRFGSPAFGKRLAALNSQAVREFWTISDAGVLPHLETPAIVIGLLRKALAELEFMKAR